MREPNVGLDVLSQVLEFVEDLKTLVLELMEECDEDGG